MILLILLIIPLGLKFQEKIPDEYISSLNYLIEKNKMEEEMREEGV